MTPTAGMIDTAYYRRRSSDGAAAPLLSSRRVRKTPRVLSALSTLSKRQLSFLFLFSLISNYSTCAYKDDSYYGRSSSGGNYYDNRGNRGDAGPDSMASSNATAQRIFFDDQGFKIVYELTNSFLYVLTVTDDADSGFNLTAMIEAAASMDPESFFQDYMASHWQELALYKIGFLICVAVGIAFIVLMPIIGFCFCCCRSCGRCGSKSDPMDDKNDNCKRATCSILLFIFTVFVLLSVVACFVTCSRFVDGVKEAPRDVRSEVALIEGVKNEMAEDVNKEALIEYEKAGVKILAAIDDAGMSVKEQIGKLSGLTPVLDKALAIIGPGGDVAEIKEDLTSVQTDVSTMSKGKLQNILNRLKDLAKSEDCKQEPVKTKCRQLEDEYLKFDLQRQLSNIPDLTAAIQKVQKILDEGIDQKIHEGKLKFDAIKDVVRDEVNEQKGKVAKIIKDGTPELQKHVQRLTDSVSQQIEPKRIEEDVDFYMKKIEKADSEKYFDYMWYVLLGLAGVTALITFFLCMGLMYGCGRRPGEGGCNRGTGANCLMMSVCFYFLFSWLLMLVTLLLFIVGGQIHLEACQPILNPDTHGNGLLERSLREMTSASLPQLASLNISRHLAQCKQNKTLLTIVNETKLFERSLNSFQNSISIDNIIPDLNRTLRDIKQSAASAVDDIDVSFLSVEANALLKDIREADFAKISNFPFDEQETKDLFSGLDLKEFADQLKAAANDARDYGKIKLEADLDELQKQLRMLHDQQYINNEVIAKIDDVSRAISRLKSKIGLEEEAKSLLTEAQAVTRDIKTKSKTIIENAVDKFIENLRIIGKEAVHQVLGAMQTDIGKCGPVWDILNNVATVGCKKILYPFNGFWFSLGWFLSCGLFTTFISIKLVSLYRKEEDYDPMYGNHLEPAVHMSRHSRVSGRDHRHGYHPGSGGGHHYHHGGGGGGGSTPHQHHAPPPYNPAPHNPSHNPHASYAQSHHVNPSYHHGDPYASHGPYPPLGPIAPSAPPPYNGDESYHSKHY